MKKKKKHLPIEFLLMMTFLFLSCIIGYLLYEIIIQKENKALDIVFNVLSFSMILIIFIGEFFFTIDMKAEEFKKAGLKASAFSFLNFLLILFFSVISLGDKKLNFFSTHLEFVSYVLLFGLLSQFYLLYKYQEKYKNMIVFSGGIFLLIDAFLFIVLSTYCIF